MLCTTRAEETTLMKRQGREAAAVRATEAEKLDADLMTRCAAGDEAAFDALMTRHRKRVLNLIYRHVGDAAEAEDLAQETFVRLYRARRKYRPTAAFSTFLHRIVVNLCLNELRRRRRHPTEPLDEAVGTEAALTSGPENAVAQRELARQVRAALLRLPEAQRMATVLRRDEDLSYPDIARAMGCSVSAVESLLHRARLNLRKYLRDYLEES